MPATIAKASTLNPGDHMAQTGRRCWRRLSIPMNPADLLVNPAESSATRHEGEREEERLRPGAFHSALQPLPVTALRGSVVVKSAAPITPAESPS